MCRWWNLAETKTNIFRIIQIRGNEQRFGMRFASVAAISKMFFFVLVGEKNWFQHRPVPRDLADSRPPVTFHDGAVFFSFSFTRNIELKAKEFIYPLCPYCCCFHSSFICARCLLRCRRGYHRPEWRCGIQIVDSLNFLHAETVSHNSR